MQDIRIGRSLESIHDDPGHDGDLGTLAEVATMSRSSFSARFVELGCQSKAAFNRAFTRTIGSSSGGVRRQRKTDQTVSL